MTNRILITVTEDDYLRAMVIAGRLNHAGRRAGNGTHHTIGGVLSAAAAIGLERVADVLNVPAPESITLEGEALETEAA